MSQNDSVEKMPSCEVIMRELCYHSEDAIIVLDGENRIFSLNQQAEDLFGYTGESLFKEDICYLFPDFIAEHNSQNLLARGKDSQKFMAELIKSKFTREGEDLYLCIVRDMRHQPKNEESHTHLSPRQLQILKLVAQGQTSREIAENLQISIKTVETHRANIMSKLGAKNMSGLVRFAIENGII